MDTEASDIGSHVLREFVSVNVKPSGCFFKQPMSRSARTEDLSGEIRAKSIASFLESSLRDNVLLFPREDKYAVTLETSHVVE